MNRVLAVSFLKLPTSQWSPAPYKIKVNNCKLIDLLITIESTSNFNATILKFSEKFDHPFSHVFIFGNMIPESPSFVAVPVARMNNLVSLQKLNRNELEHVSLIQLVTCTATKPWLSGNMYPNIKTYENGWLNFLENLRIVALKLLVNSILINKSINLQLFTLILYSAENPLWCWQLLWWMLPKSILKTWSTFVNFEKFILINLWGDQSQHFKCLILFGPPISIWRWLYQS